MMSSFFSKPASQRKRKRLDTVTAPTPKKRNTTTVRIPTTASTSKRRVEQDDEISGSESESGVGSPNDVGLDDEGSPGSEHEEETAAERRLRLAERYLENIKEKVDEVGFDAAEIDRDLIAERLKEDVAEKKGRLYRHLASTLSLGSASRTLFRADTHPTTAVAICPPYAYTVSKDMTLIKWEILIPPSSTEQDDKGHPKSSGVRRKANRNHCRKPKQIAFARGNKLKAGDPKFEGHVDHILTVAASQDGKYVVTGGKDRRLIVWNAVDLKPLRVFTQHRDAVTSLAFRRGTNQLYSGSRDRTIKIWSLDELAYVETLFGHQDEIVDVAALAQEGCVSVGARDRTARLWKVVEETQLVFRGGGEKRGKTGGGYMEGSIDRVAMVDEEMFVTGSDNGSLSLWVVHKKKPVYTIPLAHGLDPPLDPSEASAEQNPDPTPPAPPQPRWITALATIPYSDVILSGSWDGEIRAWKVSDDKKRIESLGPIGGGTPSAVHGGALDDQNSTDIVSDALASIVMTNGSQIQQDDPVESPKPIKGVVNGIAVYERGDRGKDGICIVAGIGTEHRFGRWMKVKGKNGAVVLEVHTKISGRDVVRKSDKSI